MVKGNTGRVVEDIIDFNWSGSRESAMTDWVHDMGNREILPA